MANPNVPQGTVNKLITILAVNDDPGLNVTAPYLGKGLMHISFGGKITTNIGTATGVVPSPEPYMDATITIELLKSQPFADTWKQTWENDSYLGQLTLWPDTTTLSPFNVSNASITGLNPMAFNGSEAVMVITVEGAYPINQGLYPG